VTGGTAHPSGAPPVLSGVRVAQSIVFCVMFYGPLFVLILLASVLSGFHRFTDSDYLFGISKLFLIVFH